MVWKLLLKFKKVGPDLGDLRIYIFLDLILQFCIKCLLLRPWLLQKSYLFCLKKLWEKSPRIRKRKTRGNF